ncbi:MAG: c-type cytochrome, partial [Gammaproteobacteria bacterium]|nr:c-type cytochrome [Gammaproteobacteria bacterium]
MKSTYPRCLAIAVLIPAFTFAQETQKDIYANPENLQVLPEDVSSADLGNTMKGFALGLGARCETCHVGEPNTPLHTFDFASDEKAMKRKARVMIKMVLEINDTYVHRLNEIEDSQRVEVRCVTCHRGQQQPKLIEDVLDHQLAQSGLDATLKKYAELRENFYGSHSYDFSEFTLPMYVQELAKKEKLPEAIALSKVNAEHFPDSYYTFFVLAELYSASGQTEQAIESYSMALELNPRAKPFLDAKIVELT